MGCETMINACIIYSLILAEASENRAVSKKFMKIAVCTIGLGT